jgi:hypothetical protein
MTRSNHKVRNITIASVGLALGATAAGAAIVAVFGDAVQFTPASVVLNTAQSNVNFAAFNERQCFQLANDLEVDEGVIPANTWVSCHFNHADPAAAAGAFFEGRVRYDAPIIGVISSASGLDDSDDDCMNGVVYPVPGTEPNRGLEAFQVDQYQIIMGGFGIALRFDVPSFSDEVRVITQCAQDD